MLTVKNYAGSVYGGLGQLLMCYCEAEQLPVPDRLQSIQRLERFDYVLWRELLDELYQLRPIAGLGLKMRATYNLNIWAFWLILRCRVKVWAMHSSAIKIFIDWFTMVVR